jgi:hypothetical protein
MALNSPGVQVTVIDESFYTPAEAGTTPLIVVATAQDKPNASGTGIAQGTLAANAGKVYRVGSQRELIDYFGTPTFKRTASGSPKHGDEQNEYGLQAAYSFLGASNSAYVVRADIDLEDLTAAASAPGSEATDGQWWLDTQSSLFGVFEWDSTPANVNGQKFTNKTPIVITADDTSKFSGSAPLNSVGKAGDYAVITVSDVVRVFYKGTDYTSYPSDATVSWAQVGTAAWRKFWPVFYSQGAFNLVGGETFSINGTTVTVPTSPNNTIAKLAEHINSLNIQGVKAAYANSQFSLYITAQTGSELGDSTDPALNMISLADGSETVQTLLGEAAGDYYGPELSMAAHTAVPQWKTTSSFPRPSGSVWVKTTDPNQGARWRVKRWSASAQAWSEVAAPMYANAQTAIYNLNRAGGGAGIAKESLYVQYNFTEDSGYDGTPQTASFKLFVRKNTGATSITSSVIASGSVGSTGSKSFTIRETTIGSSALSSGTVITFTAANTVADANAIATAINASALVNIEASVLANKLTISHKLGGEFRLLDTSGVLGNIGFSTTETPNLYAAPEGDTYDFVASNWLPLSSTSTGYVASNDAPLNEPVEGQRWYSSLVDEVDILVHDGDTWVGYQTEFATSNPTGPIISSTRPLRQTDGTDLVTGDLWVDTSDLENYPVMYRFDQDLPNVSNVANKWVRIDNSDATTEAGIVFADARWGLTGADTEPAAITDLLTSDYLDFDTPDPALYPKGMLLWNTRRSGFNIKVYRSTYIDKADDNIRFSDEPMTDYAAARWVTDSGSVFGRKAQRAVVVAKLKALVATNQEMREDEVRAFNLMACPGYPELIQNLVDLNIDRGTTSFIIGDSPLRLSSSTTTLANWGANVDQATDNNDTGLVSYDAYTGVFYPSGLTTDNAGNTIVVPASHMMLKTMALSDQTSYPWFAPAGLRRGAITNATAVGYIDSTTGEFKSVALTDSQRDTLYNVKVNPLTYFNGVGLVNYGQRTRSNSSSALDRINVARLVIYLRSQLNKLAKPFVFEPNDRLTRDEIKQAVESLLLELVGLRALYDYAVVCDETNNTPARIDRNELYVDIAIEPVKAIEFIYIPLRLKNTGEIAGARSS